MEKVNEQHDKKEGGGGGSIKRVAFEMWMYLPEWAVVPGEQCGARGACEKEAARRRNWGRSKGKETATWKTCLFLSSSQLGLWNGERGPTWSLILLEERAVSLLFLTSVSLWLSNQSLAEPMPVPRVSILMNNGNYSSRFWSVPTDVFFPL